MKTTSITTCILSFLLMTGCLKDEGNYEYTEVSEPTWLFPFGEQIYIYEGDSVFYKAAFRFEKDSAERLADLRYEWVLNGVVISEQRDLNMSGDSIIKKLNLPSFPESFITGTFNVIEKSTGIRYMCERLYNICPRYSNGMWMILSEDGGNARLSYQSKKMKNINGLQQAEYQTGIDFYKQKNGAAIPGTPRRMLWHEAPHISPAVGAVTVVTDQAAYEVNCENFIKSGELKDQFLDGTPSDFKVSDIYYGGIISFVATEDGRLFRRMMSEDWLGGKYISEPYVIDNRGSEVRHFGQGISIQSKSYNTGFPCYDELNRRMMLINFSNPKGKIYPVTPDNGEHALEVWNMPEGCEVLRLSEWGDLMGLNWGSDQGFVMIFNQEGRTYMSQFRLNTSNPNYYARCIANETDSVKPFPGGNLDQESLFLTTSDEEYMPLRTYIFYTKGNELRYVDRANGTDHPVYNFNAKITAIRYATYYSDWLPNYTEIAIGLANGDFMMLNIADLKNPYVIEKSRVNVGGPVREVAQISRPDIRDYY